MAVSLLYACGLNSEKLPSFVHIGEESNSDGSFVITALLTKRLQTTNVGTLLVCLHHSYQHYQMAGLRMGYNCNIFLDKTLGCIDMHKEIAAGGCDTAWLQKRAHLTAYLFERIRYTLENQFKDRANTLIIIDDFTALLHLGASLEGVQQLCHDLASLAKEKQNLSILTKINNSELYTPINKVATKLSRTYIKISQIASGNINDADGRMQVVSYDDESDFECASSEKDVLFKINDRNIKLIQPGEASASYSF